MSLSEKAIRRASEVFAQAELGDPRRVRRAVSLTEALASAPNQSLPKVWETDSELEAGYRFLRNTRNEFDALMDPVQLQARREAMRAKSILVLHDTTDIECTAAEPEEVGFLQTGKPGFYVHHSLAVTEGETPLPMGILWSQLWGRAQRSKGRPYNLSGPALAKLKERESDRWLEGMRESHLWTEECQQVVHVMDREADFFRVFELAEHLDSDFVIRLRHNRSVQEGRLAEAMAEMPIKVKRLVSLSSRKSKTMPRYTHMGRAARQAKLTVRCGTVELQPPTHMKASSPVQLQVLQVLEESPPDGEKPVSWVLATSLPLRTRIDVERVLDIYRARWIVEDFHKALKTGCMFEKRQLESFQSLTTLLAMCYPIACELLRVRTRARVPGIPATEVLRPSMLAALRAHPKARRISDDASAEEALAAIARLGGHLKHNGPPGWQTLAAGYSHMLAFEAGWLAAQSQNL